MKLDIKISNFGKIEEADIEIRPFTIIAGPNSSGKSFITKALYSIFSTINTDHISIKAHRYTFLLDAYINYIESNIARLSKKESNLFGELLKKVAQVKDSVDKIYDSNTFLDQVSESLFLKKAIGNLEKPYKSLLDEVSPKAKFIEHESMFRSIKSNINDLEALANDPLSTLSSGIDSGVVNALKENFQISRINELKNYNSNPKAEITFDLDALGNMSIDANGALDFSLNQTSIDEFQKLYNVVYLESPVYWKLKDALNYAKNNKGIKKIGRQKGEGVLNGVPKYFFDLLALLENKIKTNEEDNHLSSESIRQAIGGELQISESGDILFQEEKSLERVNLHSTALGIANLGIISLLIDRNIITKGSFLFIDEPEVHLHPSWQKLLVETLFELSKKEINIVIATHSIDMMKAIENIASNNDKLVSDGHFGINQLSGSGTSINSTNNIQKKIANIKTDLAKPFMDIFYDSQIEIDI